MPLPQETAILDPSTGFQLPPNTTGAWANLVTWSSWLSWNNRPANAMTVISTVTDRGSVGYFNLRTSTDVTGNITYAVFTSNTGSFSGEETISNISPNTGNIAAFCGRYYAVVANITEPSGGAVLRSMNITSTNSTFDLQYDDLVIGTLGGNVNHRILPLSRSVSAIKNIQVTPHYESAAYVVDDYIQSWSVGTKTYIAQLVLQNDTSLAVTSVTGFPNNTHLVVVDQEVIEISGRDANNTPYPILNVSGRGVDSTPEFGNTSPATHAVDTEVQLYDTIVFNDLYVRIEDIIGTPFVISKDRTAPAITLKNNVGASVGGTIDARITVLPEQFMDQTNLNTR